MGLSTSHKCWNSEIYSGGYGHFHKFRTNLSILSGYKMIKYKEVLEIADLDYESFTHKNYMGFWEKEPGDILIVLLIHSDCEGYIFKEHTKKLADRLKGLRKFCVNISPIKERDEFIYKINQFIDGLERAYKRKQKITFF